MFLHLCAEMHGDGGEAFVVQAEHEVGVGALHAPIPFLLVRRHRTADHAAELRAQAGFPVLVAEALVVVGHVALRGKLMKSQRDLHGEPSDPEHHEHENSDLHRRMFPLSGPQADPRR